MNNINVFLSVGGTANQNQETFVCAIEDRLRSEGLIPNTVGRNKFSSDAPLVAVKELMNECFGTIVIALERTFLSMGSEKRGGTKEAQLQNLKYPTPWNQIEAAIAYSKGLPLMLIVEEGIKTEGLLEKGNDWYVMYVKAEASSLTTTEFNGVLSSWRKKVEEYQVNTTKSIEKKSPKLNASELTIGELINSLKPGQLWGLLATLATLIAGAFALGAKLFNH
ncbi:MAG: hypothetical protein ABI834_00300 [Ginsengibacter sp.]